MRAPLIIPAAKTVEDSPAFRATSGAGIGVLRLFEHEDSAGKVVPWKALFPWPQPKSVTGHLLPIDFDERRARRAFNRSHKRGSTGEIRVKAMPALKISNLGKLNHCTPLWCER
jgi:hypothetical protein